jgi:bleomycin resistance family protein
LTKRQAAVDFEFPERPIVVSKRDPMSKEEAMSKRERNHDAKKSRTMPSIVWFEIPADNPERAKKFYGSLFGWKIDKFPGVTDYWHIDTGGGDDTPDGGLMARKHPEQPITNYVNVKSVSFRSWQSTTIKRPN